MQCVQGQCNAGLQCWPTHAEGGPPSGQQTNIQSPDQPRHAGGGGGSVIKEFVWGGEHHLRRTKGVKLLLAKATHCILTQFILRLKQLHGAMCGLHVLHFSCCQQPLFTKSNADPQYGETATLISRPQRHRGCTNCECCMNREGKGKTPESSRYPSLIVTEYLKILVRTYQHEKWIS